MISQEYSCTPRPSPELCDLNVESFHLGQPSLNKNTNHSFNQNKKKISNNFAKDPSFAIKKEAKICKKNNMSEEEIDDYLENFKKEREAMLKQQKKAEKSKLKGICLTPQVSQTDLARISTESAKIKPESALNTTSSTFNYNRGHSRNKSSIDLGRTIKKSDLIQELNNSSRNKSVSSSSSSSLSGRSDSESNSEDLTNFYKENPRFHETGALKIKISFKKNFKWTRNCKETYLEMLDNPEFNSNLTTEQLSMVMETIANLDQKENDKFSLDSSEDDDDDDDSFLDNSLFDEEERLNDLGNQEYDIEDIKNQMDFIEETETLGNMFTELKNEMDFHYAQTSHSKSFYKHENVLPTSSSLETDNSNKSTNNNKVEIAKSKASDISSGNKKMPSMVNKLKNKNPTKVLNQSNEFNLFSTDQTKTQNQLSGRQTLDMMMGLPSTNNTINNSTSIFGGSTNNPAFQTF